MFVRDTMILLKVDEICACPRASTFTIFFLFDVPVFLAMI
jgi:hypothetical protein